MIDVEFRDIAKTYNPGLFKKKVLAVSGLNLSIPRGEVFGLIGPNGAGKSTTIRMLLGLIRPSQGAILFQGQPLHVMNLQRQVGYLPENPYLYDHLTLHELLAFCGATSGMSGRQSESRRNELLERLDLVAAGKRPLRTFSKGMLQRAGICFALMHDPAMVILDEPMSGLDPLGRKMVFDLITELKGRGKTIFFCSHILSDVERLCDRIGIMVGGRLVDELESSAFAKEMKTTISLELADCPEELFKQLMPLVDRVVPDGDHHVIIFAVDSLAPVVQKVKEQGVEILGCRSDQSSLESHFLRVVEGGRS